MAGSAPAAQRPPGYRNPAVAARPGAGGAFAALHPRWRILPVLAAVADSSDTSATPRHDLPGRRGRLRRRLALITHARPRLPTSAITIAIIVHQQYSLPTSCLSEEKLMKVVILAGGYGT